MATTLLPVTGLETTSGEFRRELVAMSRRLGLNPDHLGAVMSFETGGEFRADTENPLSGAIGLIQFSAGTRARMRVTKAELAAMTPTEQLAYVERYFEPWKDKLVTLSDHYLAVFAPTGVKRPADFVVYAKASKRPLAYIQNQNLDINKDERITVAEATRPVTNIAAAAEGKPRLAVPDAPAAPSRARDAGAGLEWLAIAAGVLLAIRQGGGS